MNQYLIPLNDDMYESIDEFISEQCTYYGDENNCKSQKLSFFSQIVTPLAYPQWGKSYTGSCTSYKRLY